MNQYQKFKKWVEQEKIQKNLDKFVVIWIILIVIVSIGLSSRGLSSVLGLSTAKETPSIILPSPTPIATKVTVSCGPGQHSGQYVYLETASDCQNYTDCGFADGSWRLMKKEDCTIAQKQDIAPRQNNTVTKIDCVGPDGKHFDTTQKQCDEFNAAWGKPQQGSQPREPDWKTLVPYYGSPQKTVSSEPTVTCVLSWGTSQLSQSTCDDLKKRDNSDPTVTCVLSYGTFQISQSSCYSYKAMDNLPKPTPFQPGYINTTIVVPTSPQIIMPTPRTCTAGMVNSYGAVGAISVPCN